MCVCVCVHCDLALYEYGWGVLSLDTPTFYVYCALDEFSNDNFCLLVGLPISSWQMQKPSVRNEIQNNFLTALSYDR
ncbi:Uncharacterized protein APZ42_020773 [Daphnia magna]|uniref:Uncharacterized protein n=1 Tax=Daphnia magna TaxID=35525 RepID=A0A164XE69_9CRUS|nr:Uncharacterized protein APZ42_020773 [Daphnia magna]